VYVLGIDTSTMTGGAALVRTGTLVGEYVLNIRTTHSERLLPAIKQLLDDGNISLEDIDGIAVVTGPGSFTGIRIGVATAKGFAYSLGQDIVGVTTLEAYGWQFKFFPGIVMPLIDARRNRVYAQGFVNGEPVSEGENTSLLHVLEWCKAQENPCLMVGDGAFAYRSQIEEKLPSAVFPPGELGLLRPSAAASLGHARLSAGIKDDLFELNPSYMRKTEAEMKWNGKQT
jgi:tRNA threonylcarbamoyladenosine biosynthesis protein TsaB